MEKQPAAAEKSTTSRSDRLRVLIDVDDVIGNFSQLMVNCINASGVRALSPDWSRTQWDIAKELGLTEDEEDRVNGLLSLPGQAGLIVPLPGAVDGVKRLAAKADVYFVTSPFMKSPTWVYDRHSWLAKLFGKELGEQVAYTHHKYIAGGDFLIDDKPDNCVEWQKAWPTGIALHWAASYRGEAVPGIRSVYNWLEVERLVDAFAKLKAEANKLSA